MVAIDDACPDCGWSEGDGIKACRYSFELGLVVHGNQHPTGLSDEQSSLWAVHLQPNSIAWISEADRNRVIASTIATRAKGVARTRAWCIKHGQDVLSSNAETEREEAWRTKWEYYQRSIPLQASFEVLKWVAEPFLDGRVYMYPRHHCGGHAHNFGYGYRIGCTGCTITIQLGDHGIDEDYG